jgi:hypothetical protein
MRPLVSTRLVSTLALPAVPFVSKFSETEPCRAVQSLARDANAARIVWTPLLAISCPSQLGVQKHFLLSHSPRLG